MRPERAKSPTGIEVFLVAVEYDVNLEVFVPVVVDFGPHDNRIEHELVPKSLGKQVLHDGRNSTGYFGV